MPHQVRKIINDPVHGFITIDHPLIFQVISHPYYQRLRRIQQMALAQFVYPGAVHSRLHHSLGAYHLMNLALTELKAKGVVITADEETAARIAILLHDVGHGPYSHALEKVLLPDVHHESMSMLIMYALNREFNGQLAQAIEIFTGRYHKRFLHQLVSGQLDVDRMDYLARDSFFTGVAEGVIGHDRIIKMLTVHDGELMVEEKAIYSTEKFLVSRRLMYWQVYLHKTVLSAEQMLVRIVERARELIARGQNADTGSPALNYFLHRRLPETAIPLDLFCQLDDYDVMAAIKQWVNHPDKILRILCQGLIDRRLFKVKLQVDPIDENWVQQLRAVICSSLNIPEKDSRYFLVRGEAINTTYDPTEERINILLKDGKVKDISSVDNALIHQALSSPVKKYYICYLQQL